MCNLVTCAQLLVDSLGLFIWTGRLTFFTSWTVGNNWPYDGEVDMLEGWNNVGINKPAFHMGNAGVYGSCSIEQTGQSGIVGTSNCDNLYENKPFQYSNQGCVTNDGNGPWATANGGVCKLLHPRVCLPTSVSILANIEGN